jgi:hypothetical protein
MRNTARQTRENRTITVDFRSEATYFQWRGNGLRCPVGAPWGPQCGSLRHPLSPLAPGPLSMVVPPSFAAPEVPMIVRNAHCKYLMKK